MSVLTIAGFDPTGGAGILADIKVFQELGCYGFAAATAITSQNTSSVYKISNVDSDLLFEQIYRLTQEFEIKSIKIGMLGNRKNIQSVCRAIQKFNFKNIVLDPVMKSSSSKKLISKDCLELIRKELIPLSTVLTLNKYEGQIISEVKKDTEDMMFQIGKKAVLLGSQFTVVKGGDFNMKRAVDLLLDTSLKEYYFSNKRYTYRVHGTGCLFSSAIAAFLSLGDSVYSAIKKSKKYVTKKIKNSYLFPASKQRLAIS